MSSPYDNLFLLKTFVFYHKIDKMNLSQFFKIDLQNFLYIENRL